MALKFNPLKTKTVKDNGTYIFGDFSHGLYLLDTPRTINEQLASLALKGGRNIWAEKGALVPQFGYMRKAQLPEGEIVATVTKDSYSSSSFFIVCYSGNVYLYTSSQGLKKYKTTLPTVDNPLVTHRGNDMIVRTEGNVYLFGSYYSDSSTDIDIDDDAEAQDFGTYYTFKVPASSKDYYWNGKQLSVDSQYRVNVVSAAEYDVANTFKQEAFDFSGAGTRNINYTLDNNGVYSPIGDNNNTYNLIGTPSIDATGKSFKIKTQIYIPDSVSSSFNSVVCISSAINYAIKLTATTNTQKETSIEAVFHLGNSTELVYDTFSNLTPGNHDVEIIYDNDTNNYSVSVKNNSGEFVTIGDITSSSTLRNVSNLYVNITTYIGNTSAVANYQLKEMSITTNDELVWNGQYTETDNYLLLRATYVQDGDDPRPSLTGTVTLGEKALSPALTLTYTSEAHPEDPININPELISAAGNRLFISDVDGTIYYSAVGSVNTFDQAQGAGYFKGFFSDTSKTLSIEDYMDGVLICKENGIYYLALTSDDVTINKIANVGQQSANDHVIVRESVYAYDTNSGSIVNAASVNVFGSIVAGNTIIDSTYLDSQGRGISSSNRYLTYNALENVMILYYGTDYKEGIVLNLNSNLYPRELDIPVKFFIGFNQGVMGITEEGLVFQDFKNGTIIEGIPAYADFEAIGLRDNRIICSSVLEVTELNGVDYIVTTLNAGSSVQSVQPTIGRMATGEFLPELIYSDYSKNLYNDSFELTSRWADKKSSLTRLYAPMSGRNGVNISIEFPKNVSFCLAALRLPDFSQGE